MRVRDAMTTDALVVGRDDSVGMAARRMVERWVGSAVVDDHPPGIITERDVLRLVGAAEPHSAPVGEHCTADAVCAAPDWSLEHAAETMKEGRFRHLVVLDGDHLVGVISIRDIIRVWTVGRSWADTAVQIREAMSRDALWLSREESLREASRKMVDRRLGAAIVGPLKPKSPPGIITEREVLESVGADQDPDKETVGGHLSRKMTFSAPDWSLKQAAEAMIKGGFQHVVVVDARETLGLIAMSDILPRWLD